MALKCELIRFDADHEKAEVKCADCKKSVFVSFADVKNLLRLDECAEILCYDCAVSRNGGGNNDTRRNAAVYRNDAGT